ncbi:MAG TPA: ABC transporter substrate-binding protein [Candidatus Binatia bacterium]|nr:ABC transporter substrate-binding protein [Candidatus Binatia bacterium]
MSQKILCFALCAMLLALCVSASAQQAGKVYRIGFASLGEAKVYRSRVAAFRQGLRELGYVEGKNIVIEERYAAGKEDRQREQAAELVRLKVDVIVVHGEPIPADRAAKEAGRTIPIVMAVSADPVEVGWVASLARPGGNVTGLSDFHTALIGKRLELLKEAVPSASRIGFLWHPTTRPGSLQWQNLQAAAPGLGVTLLSFDVTESGGIDHALAAIRKERPRGLVIQGHPLTSPHVRRIAEFAIENRLPTIFTLEPDVVAGGLMSYGADHHAMYHRAATFVDKILKGANPADLPVEQPTKFEFVINLKTAKQIGLTIPPSVLARADRVIR